MASIYKEFFVDADVTQVWDALRDFGAVHTRLAPGFVTACTLDGDARDIRFANGSSAREVLVAMDDVHYRLCYTISGGQISHHHAAAQVFAAGPGRTRFVWITDVLPDALAPYIDGMMEQGGKAMAQTLRSVRSHDLV